MVQLIVNSRDAKQAKELVESKEFRPAKLQAENPLLYVRLLSLCGHTEELNAALRNAIDQVLVEREFTPRLMEIGGVCMDVGMFDLFKQRVQHVFGKNRAEEVLSMFDRHFKHGRLFPG